ncbi:MAG: mercuric transporter MerT family protein [Bacteriovoracaceae bacterium]
MMNNKPIENKTGAFIGTGIVAGLLASVCCIGPLILTLLGVSGAAALAKFDAIRIPLIFLVIGIFSFAGYTLYKKRNVCEPGSICADPKKYRKMVLAYWIGLAIAVLGVASPYIVAWIF